MTKSVDVATGTAERGRAFEGLVTRWTRPLLWLPVPSQPWKQGVGTSYSMQLAGP